MAGTDKTTRPPGFDKAYDAAWEDARQFGAGFFMMTPNGCQRIPPEAVMIDRTKYLEVTRDAMTPETTAPACNHRCADRCPDCPEDATGGFSVKQGGMVVAGGSGPYLAVKREAAHYAMMYRQDGPVSVRVWKHRRKVATA